MMMMIVLLLADISYNVGKSVFFESNHASHVLQVLSSA